MTTSQLKRNFYAACRRMEAAQVEEPRNEETFNLACREAAQAQRELADKGIYV